MSINTNQVFVRRNFERFLYCSICRSTVYLAEFSRRATYIHLESLKMSLIA